MTDEIQHSPPVDGRKRRGFASMNPERRQELARKGGSSVPSEKRSFSQDNALARDAGRKGGLESHRTRRGPMN